MNVFRPSFDSGDTKPERCPSPNMDFKPEIQSILDFRVLDGTEQYLVAWKCPSKDRRTSWEVEHVVDRMCQEKLHKFWVKNLLCRETVFSNHSVFARKLWDWAVPATQVPECHNRLFGFSDMNPKKRSHSISSEITETDEVERKHPKIVIPPEDDMVDSQLTQPLSPTSVESLSLYSDKLQSILKSEEFVDPIHVPHYEIGEITSRLKTPELENHYLVTWFYVSCESAETLGMEDDVLQKQIKFCSTDESSSDVEKKVQLHRKRHPFTGHPEAVIIKPAVIKKFSGSDSDLSSNASTHPPSEPEISGQKESDDTDSVSTHGEPIHHVELCSVEIQTEVELNPFACLYCQSRLGEAERLSSLRQKRGKKGDEAEGSGEVSGKKAEVKAAENEEDDDDLVPIEYEVEQILDYRRVEDTNVDEYYIRWKGFTSNYNTWEPEENLSTCDNLLLNFFVNRVADRRNVDAELKRLLKSGAVPGKKLPQLPPLPPVPEQVMELLAKAAPITDEEIEMAFQISKIVKKSSIWSKKKLRKMLFALIESGVGEGELPELRHQLLMVEAERRKEVVMIDLKKWEHQLNCIAKGRPEIVVENNYDLNGPPVDFKYINDNVLGEGVVFRDDPFEGCDCEDSCVKDKSQCCPGKHGKVLAYHSSKRLRVLPGYPIYECNKRCKCGIECANRVVQDGTMSLLGTKLCIFRTRDKRGWGVKTLKKIRKGTFVCLYAGEIITSEEAESRGQIYENQLGACYLFDLDYYADDNESCPYTIDATKMGNIAHFINHSCNPNLSVFNVWADCVDQNLPKLAFFALSDINKDEELTYDYGSNDDSSESPPTATYFTIPASEPDEEAEAVQNGDEINDSNINEPVITVLSSPAKNRMKLTTGSTVRRPCLCGAKNCRKVLF